MLKNAKQDAFHRYAVILLTTLVVLRSWFNNMVSLRPAPAVYSTVIELLLIALLWVLLPRGGRKTNMEWLLLAYVGWGILTRVILHDVEIVYTVRLEILMLFEMSAAFFAMHRLDGKTAAQIFTLVTAILCALLTVWAICGLIVVLTDVQEIPLLVETVEIEPKGKYLVFAPVNRNETAAWFMVGLWLLAYQWTVCKRKFWRIPMAFSMALLYLAIALQRCRTVYIAFAFTAGLLAASRLQQLKWKKLPKYLLMAVTAAACAFAVYKSFSFISDVFAASGKMPSMHAYTEKRKTVTSRSRIWKTELRVLAENPRFLIFGQMKSAIANNMADYTGSSGFVYHTHNGYIQVLAMYGLPGLILLCGFLLILAGKVLRVYFAKGNTSEKILALLLICLVIDSLMEPVFTAWIGLSTAIFMLTAGLLMRADGESGSH